MRLLLLSIALLVLAGCVTAQAATPTPAPTGESIITLHEPITCQFIDGTIYTFTPRVKRGNWLSITDGTTVNGESLRPMWVNAEHLMMCWSDPKF